MDEKVNKKRRKKFQVINAVNFLFLLWVQIICFEIVKITILALIGIGPGILNISIKYLSWSIPYAF